MRSHHSDTDCRLATGDCKKHIYVWDVEAGKDKAKWRNWNVDKVPFSSHKDSNSVLIISQNIIGKALSEMTVKLAQQFPHKRFIYKLHPKQFHSWKKDLI